MRTANTRLLLIVALVVTPLLFFGGVDESSRRSFKLLWNLGHIPFFYLWSYLFLTWARRFLQGKLLLQSSIVFFAAFSVGLAIEGIQSLIGRQFSWQDIAYDLTGTALAIAHHLISDARLSASQKKLILSVSLVTIIFLIPSPLVAIIDELTAYRQFPILANFSTPFEALRFSGNSAFSREEDSRNKDNKVLDVTFHPAKYSTLALTNFNPDWRKFSQLQINTYNPDSAPLQLSCRIHDKLHETSYAFNDRFNKTYQLAPGSNQMTINLNEVEKAPAERTMDLSNIVELTCFTIELSESRKIYFDNFHLTQQ